MRNSWKKSTHATSFKRKDLWVRSIKIGIYYIGYKWTRSRNAINKMQRFPIKEGLEQKKAIKASWQKLHIIRGKIRAPMQCKPFHWRKVATFLSFHRSTVGRQLSLESQQLSLFVSSLERPLGVHSGWTGLQNVRSGEIGILWLLSSHCGQVPTANYFTGN